MNKYEHLTKVLLDSRDLYYLKLMRHAEDRRNRMSQVRAEMKELSKLIDKLRADNEYDEMETLEYMRLENELTRLKNDQKETKKLMLKYFDAR